MHQTFAALVLFSILADVGTAKTYSPSTKVQFTPTKRDGSGCLTLLEKNPELFAPCKKKTCFLFRNEEPYIILDRSISKEEHQKPFPCKAPQNAFPDLRGVAFEVHKLSKGEDSLCAWAGSSCSPNNLVDFVILQGQRNSPYKFAITGFFIQMPKRISEQISASAPLDDDKLAFVGRTETTKGTSLGLFEVLEKTFTPGGHSLWLMAFTLLLLSWTYFFYKSAPANLNGPQLFLHIMGTLAEQYYIRKFEGLAIDCKAQNYFSVYMGLRAWLRRATAVFALVFILFVELAIVNFLFLAPTGRIEKSISSLSGEELSVFCVIRNGATEDAFRYAVDKQGRYSSPELYPWYRSATLNDCYHKVLNESDPLQYVLTFETMAWYYLRMKKIGDKMTLYNTQDSLFPFSAGLYYGKSVSPTVRQEMDRLILRLRMDDKINEIVKEQGGSTLIMERKTIGTRIVGETVAVYVFAFIVTFAVLLFLHQSHMS